MTQHNHYIVFPTQDGEVEVLDRSISGGHDRYCIDCEAVKYHTTVPINSNRGQVYMCSFCGCTTRGDPQ